jgi:hypothetical protein
LGFFQQSDTLSEIKKHLKKQWFHLVLKH